MTVPGRDPARLLEAALRHRRALGERELFVTPAGREEALRRVRALADHAPAEAPGSVAPKGAASEGIVPKDVAAEGERPPSVPAPAPVDAELARLAREATAEEIAALPGLPELRAVADACRRCGLHATRTKPVFADGSPRARVVCVGEAPGQREDETGLPFVGPAGRLLDLLLRSVGLARSDVFICNVLKCRPPGNRNPSPEEVEACSPFLRRQVALVDPAVVVAFGTFAARTLLGVDGSLGSLRGRPHPFEGRTLVATYHPAALLRNPGWKRRAWEDLQLVRALLDGDGE
ncbi:MAG: uracil-DNA glycosylase [Gemmatimonadota bacterium]|nr:uracil-DNA glycosylase [Gemmatimonadota bacterium]